MTISVSKARLHHGGVALTMRSSGPQEQASGFPDVGSARGRSTRR